MKRPQAKPYLALKRFADIVFSLLVLVIFFPLLVVVGILVRATSPGPAIYRAERVGRSNKVFRMWKFRSMVQNADQIGPSITASSDTRLTKIGPFLRKSKLDEIPQFWNVLKGDMSVVGPRPQVTKFVNKYTPEEEELLWVAQGITDFSSLWFRRQEVMLDGTSDAEADYELKVAPLKVLMARYYVHHACLKHDISIFLATIGAVLFKIDPLWCFPSDLRKQVEDRSTR